MIVAVTADENHILKNTAKTSSMICRGCDIFFELKSCSYVNSIPWIYKEKIINLFQNGRFSPIANHTFYLQIDVFANISWFRHQIWKIYNQAKASSNTDLKFISVVVNSSSMIIHSFFSIRIIEVISSRLNLLFSQKKVLFTLHS